MKKYFLILLCLSFANFGNAQIPEEAFTLTNSMYKLWENGETDKALEASLKLYELYLPFLTDRIHNTLSQKVLAAEDTSQIYNYVDKLYAANNAEINELISPFYYWTKVKTTKNPEKLEQAFINLSGTLSDSSNYKTMAERYCLLAINDLENSLVIDKQMRKNLLQKIINNLEKYPDLTKSVQGRSLTEERAWNRYLLAYSYYTLYNSFEKNGEYLVKAAAYSPDMLDLNVVHAYFYDAALLTDDTDNIGYKSVYANYLIENNQTEDALNLYTEVTFNSPTDENLETLKEIYNSSAQKEDFNTYWFNYINKMAKSTPAVAFDFTDEKLDLSKKSGKWIFIDIWGTWCAPCVRELPKLQSFYVDNSANSDSNLKIYTLCTPDKNLPEFMTKNNYTFPVSEIDKESTIKLEVQGYPTKILITPEGKYLVIPFDTEWQTYVKNYALL
ncbi:TlpA family protein disulfide reductase [Chondrinema litorale]|uniref:TlpA family protein disulfide reductase n=1 Tax=Chondrinema litorale TaxID=2994555 RepID=UPI002542774F|nr:TlpA disulfide reductase family protein [Chondrinema litorale]UZR99900.1 TlpA disulfide reductase family protein [Chondrinema litorale]